MSSHVRPTIHIRKHGYGTDKRFRRTTVAVRRVSHGGNFCGATESVNDTSREIAEGTVRLAAVSHFPGGSKRSLEDFGRLCRPCMTAASIDWRRLEDALKDR